MASIITRTSKGSALTVPEMDANFKNLNDQIIRTDSRPVIFPVVRSDIINSGVVDPRFSFSRASDGTYCDKFGVIRNAGAGVPRIDYDPVTGECRGLLIEEQRTNLLKYSEQFDNAAWGKENCIISANLITAPDGTVTADKIQETTTTNYFAVAQNPSGQFSTTYTYSCYAKAAERNFLFFNFSVVGANGTFNLTTGVTQVKSGSLVLSATSVGNGWWRCTATFTTPSSGSNVLYLVVGAAINSTTDIYAGTAGYGIYIWGAQLEAGSFPTSYIPTTTASATRAADILKIPSTVISPKITNASTIQIESKSSILTSNQTYLTIKSNTNPITQRLLKQSQAKNLLTNSEKFNLSPWIASNSTITSSTTVNPLTEMTTAWRIVDNTSNTLHSIYYNLSTGLTTNSPYTYSVYAKASGRDYFALRWDNDSSRDAIFNLSTGVIFSADSTVQATIRNIGNGWYRCAITVRPNSVSSRIDLITSANSTLSSYVGDGVSGTIIFGAQLEADEKATKYVPEPAYSIQTNSIAPTQYFGDVSEINAFDRFAIATNGSSVSYASNGKFVGTESVSLTQISDINIGCDETDTNQINGHIQKISVYNTTASKEQLITLST